MLCTPYQAAAALLAALQGELAATRGGAVERLAVYPHPEPAIEFCSMAWVGFRQVGPSDGKGIPAPGRGCAIVWQADLVMGVQRCYPVAPDNGAPPAVAVDSAARDVADDLEAMRRAVADAFADEEFRFGWWRPINPQGGAHGSRLDVSVQLTGAGAMTEPLSPMLPGDPRE